MKKRVFMLYLLFTIVISLAVNFSCLAASGPVAQHSNGLTIGYDTATGEPSTYTSPYKDVGGGSIKYRTTIGSFDAFAYNTPTDRESQTSSIESITDVQAPLDGQSGTFTGALPEQIKDLLIRRSGSYCRVVFHPTVEGYFANPEYINGRYQYICYLPSNPILSSNSDMTYGVARKSWAQAYKGNWTLDATLAECAVKYGQFNSSGFSINYPVGQSATGQKNQVIESYTQKDAVYGSYIGWAGGTDQTTGQYSPFATFDAINSRFTDTYLDIDPQKPRITFYEWSSSGFQEINGKYYNTAIQPNTATNTISFKYDLTVAEAPISSYDGQATRSPDFCVAIYDSNGTRKDFKQSTSALYESPAEEYLAPADSNGRTSTCSDPVNKIPVSQREVSFNINTASPHLPDGIYRVSLFINNPQHGIEPYDSTRHQREFYFTLGTGINLAITDIHVPESTLEAGHSYTATVDYTATVAPSSNKSFSAGAKLNGYRTVPAEQHPVVNLPTDVPLIQGSYQFSYQFDVPSGATGSVTLKARIDPNSPTLITDETSDTDNEMSITIPIASTLTYQPVSKQLGIYPATEKLKYFTHDIRLKAYWLPEGNATFSEKTWNPKAALLQLNLPAQSSSGTPYNGEPEIDVKALSACGVNSLKGNVAGLNSDTFKLTTFPSVNNANTIFSTMDVDSDNTTDKDDIQNLSCQTDCHASPSPDKQWQNTKDFGTNPNHDHDSHSGHHSHGEWSGPNEGGCTRIGDDPWYQTPHH